MNDYDPNKPISLLLVEDDHESGQGIKAMLERRDVSVVLVPDAELALQEFNKGKFDIVVADIRLGAMTGVDLLREIRSKSDDFPVILLTGYDSLETAIQAVKLGAQDYILKPLDIIDDLLRQLGLHAFQEISPLSDLVGSTPSSPALNWMMFPAEFFTTISLVTVRS